MPNGRPEKRQRDRQGMNYFSVWSEFYPPSQLAYANIQLRKFAKWWSDLLHKFTTIFLKKTQYEINISWNVKLSPTPSNVHVC